MSKVCDVCVFVCRTSLCAAARVYKSTPEELTLKASSSSSLYVDNSQKKGKYTRLVGRHANYNIGTRAAERWLHHMVAAIEELELEEEESKTCLVKYFTYTAHYIVAAMAYMRPDQVRVCC